MSSLAVSVSFVPRLSSSARPKGQYNVGVHVPKQLQLSVGEKNILPSEEKI